MKYLIILILLASPLLAQDQIIDRYFPHGISDKTFWVFDKTEPYKETIILTKGCYWTSFFNFTPNWKNIFNFNYEILGNKIVFQNHSCGSDEYIILADFDLNRGQPFNFYIRIGNYDSDIPYVFTKQGVCVSTDTMLFIKKIRPVPFTHCYLFFLEGGGLPFMESGSYHNKNGSYIYYVRGLGFASPTLVYAKIGNNEWGQLPEGMNKNDLRILTSAPNVKEQTPGSFTLAQNYPNPFNNETVIEFNLPQFSEIDLAVYDVSGKKIKTILSSQLPPGAYSEKWNGTDNSGNAVASGVYFIRLKSGQYSKFIKAVYSK